MGARDLFLGALIPALVAGIALLGLARARPGRDAPLLGALAFGAAYLVAHLAISGMPRLPLGDAEPTARDWIAWFVVLAIVLGGLREVPAWRSFAGPIAVAMLAVLMPRLWLARELEATLPGFPGLAARFGLSFVLYALWSGAERLAQRRAGPAVPIAFLVGGIGVAVCALLGRSASLAQLAGALCFALGAAAVVGFLRRDAKLQSGAVAVVSVVVTGVVANSAVYGLPLATCALLALAFATPWIAELGPASRWTGWKSLAASVLPSAACAAGAIAIAYASAPPPSIY